MSKYHNVKSDGFDSKREREVYTHLMCLMHAEGFHDRVANVERQVRYTLIPAQRGEDGKVVERACSYMADFRVTYADGRIEVIDVKGMLTDVYKIKRKLMLYVHGIKIKEVK